MRRRGLKAASFVASVYHFSLSPPGDPKVVPWERGLRHCHLYGGEGRVLAVALQRNPFAMQHNFAGRSSTSVDTPTPLLLQANAATLRAGPGLTGRGDVAMNDQGSTNMTGMNS